MLLQITTEPVLLYYSARCPGALPFSVVSSHTTRIAAPSLLSLTPQLKSDKVLLC